MSMDSQDHTMNSTSAGHEGHDVHLCHRCGWPFPNPHPSAKHRRAHKRVCGKVEGYEVIISEEHDHHLTVSDEGNTSDDDDHHTPTGPKSLEKNGDEFGGSGGVGEKSNRTEDDVFADAATEFGDSGNSLRLQEQLDTLSQLDKTMEEKPVESDVNGGVSQEADKAEPLEDPVSSKEIVKPSKVGPATDEKAEASSVGNSSDLQPDDVKFETPRAILDDTKEVVGVETEDSGKKSQQDIDMEGEDKLATGNLNSEEVITSGLTLVAAEKTEELCDKLVSESKVIKHDLSPQTENPKDLEACDGVQTVTDPVETASSNKNVVHEIGIADENHENDATVGLEKVDNTAGDIETDEIVGKSLTEESLLGGPSDTAEPYDVVSSIDKNLELESSVTEGKNPEGKAGKCDVAGNEVGNVEFEDKFSTGPISTLGNNEQTTTDLKEHGNQCEEKPTLKSSEPESQKGVVETIFDSKTPSDKSTDIPLSREAELSHDDVQKGNITLGTSKYVNTSLPELPNQIHARNDGGTENIPVNGTFTELKDTEQLISNDSTASLTGSKLTGNSAEENSCFDEGVRAEPHKSNVVVSIENSKRSDASLNNTSPDTEDGKTSEDISTSQVVGIVLGAKQTTDGKDVKSDECSPTGDEMNNIIDVEHTTSTNKSLQDKIDDNKLTESKHCVTDKFETISESTDMHSQSHKTTTEEAHLNTFVQSGGEGNKVAENKNKHDEVITKVTNRGTEKQHSPLKDLLDDVKPSTKQDPAENEKGEEERKNNGAVPEADLVKDGEVSKDIEEWNSPARYPIEEKKVKKKKSKSYWVPFVCCSSVHRDL